MELKADDLCVIEQQLLASCHPKQLDFVCDPGRRVAALVGRGGGKTTGGRARLLLRMLRTPKAKCVYIAQTREVVIDLMWNPLKDLLDKLGIEARLNETSLRCTLLRNGATLRLVGCDDVKQIRKLRGQPFHEVHIDESASLDVKLLDHLIYRIIGPRLGDLNGCLVLYGTPEHQQSGPFFEATSPGSSIARDWKDRDEPQYAAWSRWSVHRWTLYDGAAAGVPAIQNLLAEALLEKETNGWTDENAVWRREYLGEWASDDTERIFKYRPFLEDGTPWNQWDPERILLGPDKLKFAKLPDGDWQYVWGIDLGHSDSFVIEILAWSPTSPKLLHVFEYEKSGMYTRTIAEFLAGKTWVEDILKGKTPENPGGVIGAIGWPVGAVADKAALGGAILEELAQVYGIRIESAEKKEKFDSIEMTNGDLVDGRLVILKGSNLETQMVQLQWSVDEYGRLKEKKGDRNDCTDGLIYGRRKAMHLFSEESKADRPARGSPELANLEMQERNERDMGKTQNDFESFLGEDNFDFFE